MTTTTTTCPAWCEGQHSMTLDPEVGAIVHERVVTAVDLHPGDPRSTPLEFAISADELQDGALREPLIVTTPYIPDGMTLEQARMVADALARAIDRLEVESSNPR
jgi:hypothetical protein